MSLTADKIAGWALLFLGIVVIFWGIYSSYRIFTAKENVPEVFSSPAMKNTDDAGAISDSKTASGKTEDVANLDIEKIKNMDPKELQNLQAEQQSQMQNALAETMAKQMENIIPQGYISKIMNLSSWSIFVFILIFAGGRISSIGIKLLKD